MANTPTPSVDKDQGLISLNLFLDDEDKMIGESFQIHKLKVYRKVNQIGSAIIYFLDGNVAERTFPVLDDDNDFFRPGTAIRVELGYGSGKNNEVVFKGIVSQIDIKLRSDGEMLLAVRLVEKVYRMRLNRRFRTFEELTNGDLYQDLIERYEGLSAGSGIWDTGHKYPSLVQYNESDWSFLLSRAKAEGGVVVTNNDELNVVKPGDDGADKSLLVSFGTDILKHELSFTALSILPEVKAVSWDATNQSLREEFGEEPDLPKQGDEKTEWSVFEKDFSDEPQELHAHADLAAPVLQAWASARAQEYGLRKVRGSVTVDGTCAPRLNTLLEIQNLGNYFTGNGLITGIEQEVVSGEWTTKLSIGQPREMLSGNSSQNDSSPYTPLEGLRVGLVKQVHDDPESNGRVLVELPGVEGPGIWARVAQVYATKDGGGIFYPEVDSEVLLSFLHNDPQSPIILGGLQSQTNATPLVVDQENAIKGFLLSSGIRLTIDEKRKEIMLQTPAGNEAVLSDEDKQISFSDQHGNLIRMDDKGITIKSAGEVTIEASSNFKIEGGGNGEITAKGALKQKGMNVEVKADAKIEQRANIIQTKGSATVVLKGGIIKIN